MQDIQEKEKWKLGKDRKTIVITVGREKKIRMGSKDEMVFILQTAVFCSRLSCIEEDPLDAGINRPYRWARRVGIGFSVFVALLTFAAWCAGHIESEHLMSVVLRELPAPALLFLSGLSILICTVSRAFFAAAVSVASLVVALFPVGRVVLHQSHPEAGGRTFGVVTYNVEKWTGGGMNIGRALSSAPIFSQSENPLRAICLQEAGRDYQGMDAKTEAAAFAAALPEFQFVFADEIAVGTNLPIISHTVTPLPVGPQSRPILDVVVEVEKTQVSIISAHLVYNRFFKAPFWGMEQGSVARLQQVSFILGYLESIPHPVVLCGDLNASPRSRSIQRLSSALTDAFATQGSGFGFTFPKGLFSRRIDYIFTRNLKVNNATVLPLTTSDHFPMSATFEVTPQRDFAK